MGPASTATVLRARLTSGGTLLLPGCADALTARIAADVGFEAVYATGAGISNALLAMPDVGLATLTEMADQVGRICDAVDLPVIVDIDTGYGNAVNAVRTVRLMERAGAAGVQVEDQVFPKRCGHFSGKEVIPLDEMQAKLRAVLDERRNAETVVIARTDALAVAGYSAAIERANAFSELGADIVFVEAPPDRETLARLPADVRAPLLANMVEGGRTPICSLADLTAMGYRLVLYANTALRASMLATREALGALLRDGDSQRIGDRLISWEERQRLARKPWSDDLEARYSEPT